MNGSILVFDPTARNSGPQQARRALDELAGKVIGFIDNTKPNFACLVDDLASLLMSTYGVAAVIKRSKRMAGIPAPDSLVTELVKQCDAVITGSGD